jgi:GDPmannose 4,6-dehydratase
MAWNRSEEKGIRRGTDEILVEVDPIYFRPTEVELLLGDPTKAKVKMGWNPRIKFRELIGIMVQSDFRKAKFEEYKKAYGNK